MMKTYLNLILLLLLALTSCHNKPTSSLSQVDFTVNIKTGGSNFSLNNENGFNQKGLVRSDSEGSMVDYTVKVNQSRSDYFSLEIDAEITKKNGEVKKWRSFVDSPYDYENSILLPDDIKFNFYGSSVSMK